MPDGANHVAFAYSADGKDRFMTVYPNLNLLDGTKDFSGDWVNASSWVNDGTYKDLTVKKRTAQWNGIYKNFIVPKDGFTAPKDGTYTFSAYVKSSGNPTSVTRYSSKNGVEDTSMRKVFSDSFDWMRDSTTTTLKAGDTAFVKYEITGNGKDSVLRTAGHKWEEGPIATPWMPSFRELTAGDYPSYIGTYTDNDSNTQSTSPEKYTWKKIVE